MQKNKTAIWMESSWLVKENESWIDKLYKNFLNNPDSVDAKWRFAFEKLVDKNYKNIDHILLNTDFSLNKKPRCKKIFFNNYFYKKEKVIQLINAFRFYGHVQAKIDPINILDKKNHFLDPTLDPKSYDLQKEDFKKNFFIEHLSYMKSLHDIYYDLKKIYCTSIGSEYMHISNTEERYWIQKNLEDMDKFCFFENKEKIKFMQQLTHAESFEHYLGKKFPGAKRFSLEGAEALIPMLKEIIFYSSKNNMHEIFLGMAHRGRLNVLVNIFGKSANHVFNEFINNEIPLNSTGDVKYHLGYYSNMKISGRTLRLILAYNPSHLEIVYPVIIGSVRARMDILKNNDILPLVIHGDAAISGQGVVQETLNFSQVRGYKVGGTIHIIINNQIGFTTSNLKDIRSTKYCTDIAKMVEAPIFHVNGDDIEAVIFVTRIALEFRKKFKKDVFIDLVCYRRQGHNESDDPTVTQPIMYKKIKNHPSLCKIYSKHLISNKIITAIDVENMISDYKNTLDTGRIIISEMMTMKNFDINKFFKKNIITKDIPTSLNIENLKKIAKKINTIPEHIIMHPQVKKIYQNRIDMAHGKKLLDWGTAEILAYASLLYEGISCRLSGEDASRGTFFHRHAIIYDQKNGLEYIPLQNIIKNQGMFTIWDSVLSEEATLAFEYGYSAYSQNTLNIWEAQFGDFANNAQVPIDQFIVSGEKKWGQKSNLVMLLPHGYEGQGPEHSSARLERYLQLCSDNNIKVCIPSTPAQIYHILRLQALKKIKKPLVIISPKSLLRHPLAVSTLKELSYGNFIPVIDEIELLKYNHIQRVVLCSGKIYYELIQQRRKNNQKNIAIIRIEQLYPFPIKEIEKIFENYKHVQDFIWCQEEPKNQGAWYYNRDYLYKLICCKSFLKYVGRSDSAVTAEGFMFLHKQEQKKIISKALNFNSKG